MDQKTIGHAAYSKWAELRALSYQGLSPRWEDLPESAKAGWEEIAQAVVDANMAQKAQAVAAQMDKVNEALRKRGL